MDLNKKLEELKPYQLNCNVFDVYSYNGLSMQDLLCQFFTKINECVSLSNNTIDLTQWLVNEGLSVEVVNKLTLWLNDGTLEDLIDIELLNGVKSKTNKIEHDLYNYVNVSTLFTQNVDFGANYFRIPFMCVTKHGTIVAGSDIRYNSGNDQSFIDIGTARSVDGGKTWIDKTVAMANSRYDSVYSRCMDGTILYDEITDRIWLMGNYWNTGESNWSLSNTHKDPNWDCKICYSDDDGRTWSTPKSIRDLCPEGYSQFIGGVGSGIRMSNGTLVFPIQISPIGDRPSFYTESGIVYSLDNGASWNISSTFVPGFASECNVVEYDNKLWINCRQENSKYRKIYTTTNLGNTWTYNKLSEGAIQNSVCQGSMIKIPLDNESVLFSSPDGDNRNGLNLKVLSSSLNNFAQVTSIHHWATHGYSCLAYDKYNNKLYIVHEIWGSIEFKDISYCLKDIKNAKAKTILNQTTTHHDVMNIYISTNGDDSNNGFSSTSPIKTFKKVYDIAKNNNYTRLDIHVNNFNGVFNPFNLIGDIRINSSDTLNLKQCYIRNVEKLQFNCDVNIEEGFSTDYGLAIEGSNVSFKHITCNLDFNMSPIYSINSKITINNELVSNKSYKSLITAKGGTETYMGVELETTSPLIMADLTHHVLSINEASAGLPIEAGESVIYNRSYGLLGNMNLVVTYNRNIIPTFNGSKTTNRNNGTKCFIANSFVHYTISLNVSDALKINDVLFTMKPMCTPLIEKMIMLNLYGSGGTTLGSILAKVKTNGDVVLVGNAPEGVVEIYANGSYFIV